MSIAFGNFNAIDFNTADGTAVAAAFNQNGGAGGANPAFGGVFNTTVGDAAYQPGQLRFLHWNQHLHRDRKRCDICWIH